MTDIATTYLCSDTYVGFDIPHVPFVILIASMKRSFIQIYGFFIKQKTGRMDDSTFIRKFPCVQPLINR